LPEPQYFNNDALHHVLTTIGIVIHAIGEIYLPSSSTYTIVDRSNDNDDDDDFSNNSIPTSIVQQTHCSHDDSHLCNDSYHKNDLSFEDGMRRDCYDDDIGLKSNINYK
jgi:hypothetical protein